MCDEKFYYRVCVCAEDDDIGLLLLTQEEAEHLSLLMNPKSWTAPKYSMFGGLVKVECDYPLSQEFVDFCLKHCDYILEQNIESIYNRYKEVCALIENGKEHEDALREVFRYCIYED